MPSTINGRANSDHSTHQFSKFKSVLDRYLHHSPTTLSQKILLGNSLNFSTKNHLRSSKGSARRQCKQCKFHIVPQQRNNWHGTPSGAPRHHGSNGRYKGGDHRRDEPGGLLPAMWRWRTVKRIVNGRQQYQLRYHMSF